MKTEQKGMTEGGGTQPESAARAREREMGRLNQGSGKKMEESKWGRVQLGLEINRGLG